MFGAFARPRPAARTHSDCSGCSLCLLVCPVWRETRDLMLTPHGRAKALQHGATPQDLAQSADSCTLCGACEPVCPERIDIVDLTLSLRGGLNDARSVETPGGVNLSTAPMVFLPDTALLGHPDLIRRCVDALGGQAVVTVGDCGADIVATYEAGHAIPDARRASFMSGLQDARRVIVANGLLLRWLRRQRPALDIVSLGLALSRIGSLRDSLRAGDLYVIEPHAYHLDHDRLVTHYDELRRTTGCSINLDLQRIAIPARIGTYRNKFGDAAQTRWLLHGHDPERIIVEDIADIGALRAMVDRPVLHISELA